MTSTFLFFIFWVSMMALIEKAQTFQGPYRSSLSFIIFGELQTRCYATQYTIDEPGVDRDVLLKTVAKHWEHLPRYLSSKPVAAHTQEAFDTLQEQLAGNDRPIILDSGCGTGRSTIKLGELYPSHVVIGVDRSIARLSKNCVYNQHANEGKGNTFLVRAELADFWRLWLDKPLGKVEKHFLLYPNPYPKKRRFQNRWYAHPAFPMILRLGGGEMVVRSNWRAFLEDFAQASSIAQELDKSNYLEYKIDEVSPLDPSEEAWTNFEAKYFDVGEVAYELRLIAQDI